MFTFKVIPDGGEPYTLKAGTRDVLTWEKTTKGKSYADLLDKPNLVDYFKLAHLAAWRQQLFTGSLKEFEDSHEIDLMEGYREMVARIDQIVSSVIAPDAAVAAVREVLGGADEAADEEPDPTRPGHSSGPSSPSPSEPESPRRSGRKKATGQ